MQGIKASKRVIVSFRFVFVSIKMCKYFSNLAFFFHFAQQQLKTAQEIPHEEWNAITFYSWWAMLRFERIVLYSIFTIELCGFDDVGMIITVNEFHAFQCLSKVFFFQLLFCMNIGLFSLWKTLLYVVTKKMPTKKQLNESHGVLCIASLTVVAKLNNWNQFMISKYTNIYTFPSMCVAFVGIPFWLPESIPQM